MSLCDKCFHPGACCKNFRLTLESGNSFAAGMLKGEAKAAAEWRNLPFLPSRRGSDGRWKWKCSELGADGRCNIYESRPGVCRAYIPASDGLCVHFKGAEGT